MGLNKVTFGGFPCVVTLLPLHRQNGSIMEGLALWKNNVDKRFEGVEDCMICFSVIHGFNYSLPKKACRTCKKKFHSACLVRQRETSISCAVYCVIFIWKTVSRAGKVAQQEGKAPAA